VPALGVVDEALKKITGKKDKKKLPSG